MLVITGDKIAKTLSTATYHVTSIDDEVENRVVRKHVTTSEALSERCPIPAMSIMDCPRESSSYVHETHVRIHNDLKIESVKSLAGEIYGRICSSKIVNRK